MELNQFYRKIKEADIHVLFSILIYNILLCIWLNKFRILPYFEIHLILIALIILFSLSFIDDYNYNNDRAQVATQTTTATIILPDLTKVLMCYPGITEREYHKIIMHIRQLIRN